MSTVAWPTIMGALQTWVAFGTGQPGNGAIWAGQPGARRPDPWLSLNITDTLPTGLDDWETATDNFISFALPVGVVNPSPANTFTIIGHGRATGDGPFQVTSTGAIPTGLAPTTNYWFSILDPNTVQVAATLYGANTGAAVAFTDAGSGTITCTSQSYARRVGQEVTRTVSGVREVVLSINAYALAPQGQNAAVMLLNDLRAARFLPSQKDVLRAASCSICEMSPVHNIGAVVATTQWESRAHMDVHLYVPSSLSEFSTYIEETSGTGTFKTETGQTTVPFDWRLPENQ